MLIETPSGGRGTGFLVGRSLGGDQWKVYLMTNKHVLHVDPAQRAAMDEIGLHVNIRTAAGIAGERIRYALKESGRATWREHPDPEVDVLAIPASAIFAARTDLANKFAPEDLFATQAVRQAMDISAGEEIVVVGYPNGIRQGKTNLPLVRQGIIATRVGDELHEEEPLAGGGIRVRESRGFLIDGATIPGSSGSPVVLKPVIGRQQGNTIVMGTAKPVLLGIVAETRFAPITAGTGVVPGFAGLGLAFELETIVETLDIF